MKIIGYVRLSREEKQTGHSLAAQTSKINAYAAAYGHELVALLEDDGFSGKDLKRPAIQKALEMLRGGQAEGVLVAKLDRLSRSVTDTDTLVRSYFTEGAEYHSCLLAVDQRVDTATAAGRMFLNVMMTVSQWERETISERVKTVLAHLKAQGIPLGQKTLESTKEGGKAVARIQELKAQGMSLRGIAGAMTEEGFPTKRSAGKWSAEAVRLVLARGEKEAA